ncbi:hypothetical protein COMNV_01139 [Commensalibacter sp. Nvir]|uniref:phosphoserine phosphatase SerB n=1 Tax=Commensalibacter sp. Nvir TaxID=3069817 RepID=UPI002D526E99|nr:hypothetical protein COMNV_01139 [Commensalibacter sp. Nvir]
MAYILTLVTPKPYLNNVILGRLSKTLRACKSVWLSAGQALDIYLPPFTPIHQARALRLECKDRLSHTKTDIFLTLDTCRQKKLLVADMDNTIVHGETLDELAKKTDVGPQIAEITNRAMNGELDFRQALKERVALLKDLSTDFLDKTWENIALNQGAKTLIATMKKHHAYCILLSGGFSFFTQKVAAYCGFNEHHANHLCIYNDKLTGKVKEPILDNQTKLKILNEKIISLNLRISETIAVGDGANDIPMLKRASIGVGYYPKPIVKNEMDNIIEHTNLTSLLFLQGYRAQQIVDVG